MSKRFLLYFFLLKVVVGIAYGAIQFYYYGYGDTFFYFQASRLVARTLPEYPLDFLKLTFGPVMRPLPPEILEKIDVKVIPSYGLPRKYMLIRINSVIQLFSFGHYYVHSVFFAFISFTGIYWLLQFFLHFYEEKKKWFIGLLCFFPSLLFWGTGAHKDGMILFGFGLILFSILKVIKGKNVYWTWLLFAAWLTYKCRNYSLLIFIPALLALLASWLHNKYTWLKFGLVYLLGGLFFFLGKNLHPKFNFPAMFMDVQNVFLSLKGRSSFEMENLEPSFSSFVKLAPQGLYNILVRPGFGELKSVLHTITLADNMLFLAVLAVAVLFGSYRLKKQRFALFLFCIAFSFSFLIIIGLVVTNLGALVRYKITATVFLLAAAAMLIDEDKLNRFLGKWRNR